MCDNCQNLQWTIDQLQAEIEHHKSELAETVSKLSRIEKLYERGTEYIDKLHQRVHELSQQAKQSSEPQSSGFVQSASVTTQTPPVSNQDSTACPCVTQQVHSQTQTEFESTGECPHEAPRVQSQTQPEPSSSFSPGEPGVQAQRVPGPVQDGERPGEDRTISKPAAEPVSMTTDDGPCDGTGLETEREAVAMVATPADMEMSADEEGGVSHSVQSPTLSSWLTESQPTEEGEIVPVEPQSIADIVREAAEAAQQQTGYVYDEASGLYYDSHTGYYYDAEKGLHYDGYSGTYYYFNSETNTYEYHSQIDASQMAAQHTQYQVHCGDMTQYQTTVPGHTEHRAWAPKGPKKHTDAGPHKRKDARQHRKDPSQLRHIDASQHHRKDGSDNDLKNKRKRMKGKTEGEKGSRKEKEVKSGRSQRRKVSRSPSRQPKKKRKKHRREVEYWSEEESTQRTRSTRASADMVKASELSQEPDKLSSVGQNETDRCDSVVKQERPQSSGQPDEMGPEAGGDEARDVLGDMKVEEGLSDVTTVGVTTEKDSTAVDTAITEEFTSREKENPEISEGEYESPPPKSPQQESAPSVDITDVRRREGRGSKCRTSRTKHGDSEDYHRRRHKYHRSRSTGRSDTEKYSNRGEGRSSERTSRSGDRRLRRNRSWECHKYDKYKRRKSDSREKSDRKRRSERSANRHKGRKKGKRDKNQCSSRSLNSDSKPIVIRGDSEEEMEEGEVMSEGEVISSPSRSADSWDSSFSSSSESELVTSDLYSSSGEDSRVTDLGNESDSGNIQGLESDEISSLNYPPCIRAIVTQSNVLDEGSLFIILYTGATIGRSKELDHAILIDEIIVSKMHCDVQYNQELQQYEIRDHASQAGTYVNGNRLSEAKVMSPPCPVTHLDTLTIGGTTLELHIHPGTDTCDACEPGLVMAKIQEQRQAEKGPVLAAPQDREKLRRQQLRQLRKKYGLENTPYVSEASEGNPAYKDKAAERRRTVGSDNPYQKDDAPASVHQEISSKNKGHKMLSKMGWKQGDSLGKTQTGIKEPIQVSIRSNQSAGLGSASSCTKSLDDVCSVPRSQQWIKAQERYNKLQRESGQPQPNTQPQGMEFIQGNTETLRGEEGVERLQATQQVPHSTPRTPQDTAETLGSSSVAASGGGSDVGTVASQPCLRIHNQPTKAVVGKISWLKKATPSTRVLETGGTVCSVFGAQSSSEEENEK